MTPADLSRVDRDSVTWRMLKRHIEHRIEAQRAKLEGNIEDWQTQRIRGSIRELRDLLKAVEPPKDITQEFQG